jgi:hypothetical protein
MAAGVLGAACAQYGQREAESAAVPAPSDAEIAAIVVAANATDANASARTSVRESSRQNPESKPTTARTTLP